MAFFRPKTSKTSTTPAEISGGHQRLHSRTENVSGPLDEPMARRAWSLLREMRDSGMCIVFSSHILEEVRILCDNVAIVSAGCVVAQGFPEFLCRQTSSVSLEDAFVKLTSQENFECLPTRS